MSTSMGFATETELKNSWLLDEKEASQVALVVKNPPASAGDARVQVRSLGHDDSLEEVTATHSSILCFLIFHSSSLAWRIPWTRSLAGDLTLDEKGHQTLVSTGLSYGK